MDKSFYKNIDNIIKKLEKLKFNYTEEYESDKKDYKDFKDWQRQYYINNRKLIIENSKKYYFRNRLRRIGEMRKYNEFYYQLKQSLNKNEIIPFTKTVISNNNLIVEF